MSRNDLIGQMKRLQPSKVIPSRAALKNTVLLRKNSISEQTSVSTKRWFLKVCWSLPLPDKNPSVHRSIYQTALTQQKKIPKEPFFPLKHLHALSKRFLMLLVLNNICETLFVILLKNFQEIIWEVISRHNPRFLPMSSFASRAGN